MAVRGHNVEKKGTRSGILHPPQPAAQDYLHYHSGSLLDGLVLPTLIELLRNLYHSMSVRTVPSTLSDKLSALSPLLPLQLLPCCGFNKTTSINLAAIKFNGFQMFKTNLMREPSVVLGVQTEGRSGSTQKNLVWLAPHLVLEASDSLLLKNHDFEGCLDGLVS